MENEIDSGLRASADFARSRPNQFSRRKIHREITGPVSSMWEPPGDGRRLPVYFWANGWVCGTHIGSSSPISCFHSSEITRSYRCFVVSPDIAVGMWMVLFIILSVIASSEPSRLIPSRSWVFFIVKRLSFATTIPPCIFHPDFKWKMSENRLIIIMLRIFDASLCAHGSCIWQQCRRMNPNEFAFSYTTIFLLQSIDHPSLLCRMQ